MNYLIITLCLALCAGCGGQEEEKPLRAIHSNSSLSWINGHSDTERKVPMRLEDQVLNEEGMDAEKVTIMDMMDRVMEERQ
jgi:hypothetical protein